MYQRLQVRLNGHRAVHAVGDMLRSVCLTIVVFTTQIEMNECFQVKILTREIDDLQLKLTTLRESSRPTTYVSTDPMRPWRTVSTRAPAPPSDASDLGT